MMLREADCRRLGLSLQNAGQDAERLLCRAMSNLRSEASTAGFSSRASGTPSDGGQATVVDEDGIPMPALSDPTGEAAIRPSGRAGEDMAELVSMVRWVEQNAGRMVGLLHRYGNPELPADGVGDGECRLCRLHADVGEKVHRAGLCRWHYDRPRSEKWGRQATRAETIAKVEKGAVRVSVDPKAVTS